MAPHWLLAIAVAVGAAVPMQSAVNARMGGQLGHPLYGALTNTAVATLVLSILVLAFRAPAPRLDHAASGPWWLWTGGLVGAAFVFGALFVAPRIGAASFAAATIFGTIAASLLIDHFGLFGFPVQPANMARVGGGVLILAGLAMLNAGRS